MNPEHCKKRATRVAGFRPDGAHSGEGVHGLKPLVDGLRQQAGKLLVVEDFQVAPWNKGRGKIYGFLLILIRKNHYFCYKYSSQIYWLTYEYDKSFKKTRTVTVLIRIR
jgi:hypothetical protein